MNVSYLVSSDPTVRIIKGSVKSGFASMMKQFSPLFHKRSHAERCADNQIKPSDAVDWDIRNITICAESFRGHVPVYGHEQSNFSRDKPLLRSLPLHA